MNYEQFIAQVKQVYNLDLSCYHQRQMERRITTFALQQMGEVNLSRLWQMLSEPNVFNQFLNAITIGVTEFFRDPEIWKQLLTLLPPLLENNNIVHFWSAACSTGEEPYSLAILMDHYFPGKFVSILASDLNPNYIAIAKKAIYYNKQLKNVPHFLVRKYFKSIGNDLFQLDNKITSMVSFKVLNLLKDSFPYNQHLICCRNMMIYLNEETQTFLFSRLYKALAPNGILFVGLTEAPRYNSSLGVTAIKPAFFKKTQ